MNSPSELTSIALGVKDTSGLQDFASEDLITSVCWEHEATMSTKKNNTSRLQSIHIPLIKLGLGPTDADKISILMVKIKA